MGLGDLGGALYQVATPAEARVVPVVKVQGGTVVAGLKEESGGPGPPLSPLRWLGTFAGR
ncbi:hypothetical protein Asp14428_45130 [Actinoplanes sp. NBRC 14428]|nr:hypothetical protein Asp14428_45130 [Actinoplanes sp. NBRC 14428]